MGTAEKICALVFLVGLFAGSPAAASATDFSELLPISALLEQWGERNFAAGGEQSRDR